jgi:hypothetical protein
MPKRATKKKKKKDKGPDAYGSWDVFLDLQCPHCH